MNVHRFTSGRSAETTKSAPVSTSNATLPVVGGSVDERVRAKTPDGSYGDQKISDADNPVQPTPRWMAVLRFWLWVMAPCNGVLAGLLSWYCFHFSTASTHLGMCVIAAIATAAITAHNAFCALRTARISSISAVSAAQPRSGA